MEFPCTECGACCARVTGPPLPIWQERGWLTPSGACKHYDARTKRCLIYEERPIECRDALMKPDNLSLADWYVLMGNCCDRSHRLVYGTERERGTKCQHPPVVKLESLLPD
jgi:hypothetical protein